MRAASCKIFVTVGFAFQDFSRLIREMDAVAAIPGNRVFMQIGSCRFVPRNAEYVRFCESTEPFIAEADLVVSHGGMTVLDALNAGKSVIAVPRLARYGEVMNDHQLEFVRRLEDRPGVFAIYDRHIPAETFRRALLEKPARTNVSNERARLIGTLRAFTERSHKR